MADGNWRKRDEFDTNSSEEEDEPVELRNKCTMVEKTASLDISNSYRREMTTGREMIEDIFNKFDMDEYGSTPPRTRIKNKTRDWDRKQQKLEAATTKAIRGNRMSRKVNRRNTLDCALLNEIFIDDDTKKCDKRSMQLLRESERDMKLSSGAIYPIAGSPTPINTSPSKTSSTTPNYSKNVINTNKISTPYDERDSFPPCRVAASNISCLSVIPKLIETGNRFMSVTSRPIGCRSSAPAQAFQNLQKESNGQNSFVNASAIHQPKNIVNNAGLSDKSMLQTRQEFHETFANLIKLGSSDKQDAKLSSEDYLWQTELKDMIWLELQARHASRTLEQQDKYLYSARQGIPDLLNKILNYRFVRRFEREVSVSSTDSGVSEHSPHPSMPSTPESTCTAETQSKPTGCSQCYSMYCKDCQEQQTIALREVEELLTRLEAAEALYPSSQILANFHPVYRSPKFVGRVKAMCLWYNITRHHRLKLLIVGKIFARLQGKAFQWPLSENKMVDSSASSSIQENEDSGRDSIDSRKVPQPKIPKVKFTCDGDSSSSPADSVSVSPSDSIDSMRDTQNCSLDAIENQSVLNMHEYQDIFKHVDLCGMSHSPSLSNMPLSPYRKYIEHVLKSRGLGQSLSFLHRLHNTVLRKAHATLEVPGAEESDLDFDGFNDEIRETEIPLSKDHEEELRRYGIWSEEATSLNLPSYVPAFVFLSIMPLEVMHEYLRMRLESKPVTPNPLSLEQLMKELREGLILAMTHRERYNKHIHTAFYDKETELEKHMLILEDYDATVYLEYVEQWVLVAAPEGHRKNALDKEWMFSKLICPMIPGQHANVAKKFCQIVSDLLQITGNRLINRSQDLDNQINDKTNLNEDEKKWQILTVCRNIQALFTLEREKTMRLMSFAKSLCRDIEMPDFHRDHDSDGRDFVCQVVKDAVTKLQKDVLSVRDKLTKIIERVQERCDVKYLGDKIDEADKMSILSRAREILHQGYKFGFEYHKDISRLFETKIVSCKDKSCEFNLSLGIINFAKMWMEFVTQRCERGRGVRPRWATLGLEFLIAACDPSNTVKLSDYEFDDLKTKMDACISHVVGIGTEPADKIRKPRASPRARKISPNAPTRTPNRRNLSPRISNEQRQFMNSMSVREEVTSPTSAPNTPELVRKQTSCDQVDNVVSASSTLLRVPKMNNFGPALRQVRVRDAVNHLDLEIDRKMRDKKLIGQIKTIHSSDKIQIKLRSVNFRWHRGIKIGQGRFGKVYTAVNNLTGELMAMKEIAIQPGETKAIRNVAEELKIFEGISHKHLVKLYGVEIHREELLIFMELCSEGTLESLVEMSNGLHEGLTRRYAAQLLDAVAELHRHGVVHRDIKPANIFLTKSGNCLKLGDFGSAVKIQAHTTIPGELQAYVGTQAYMAPEVFTRNHTDGHGRAADIWSVGCVVIEMASGKRPWAQFDQNYQIMFKVGMGESPEIPDTLSEEGQNFLQNCLEHNPKERWLASELLQHHFCKVDFHDDASTENDDNQKSNASK
ncbi:mitogen-activated protein kinase kinase kinase 4 isoform X3 [Contarinia nasturtii]|uniref:mitogen-activated protein kinase kinase kinase 4 isoform X3 n=1 Tax=Contarinia nasturtii TaxID=265458 RepID=UPI0012D4AB73|nr:mitogen-activated protein kinase kinase kinase 4 isoform X3 [Contarinia nasturtii]